MTITLTFSDLSTDCWSSQGDGTLYEGDTVAYIAGSPTPDDITNVWLPFVVTLPKITIVSATLRVRASANGNTDIEARLAAESISNSPKPTTYANMVSKTLTTANIYPITLPTVQGTEYSYDVTAIVQEVLNISGWASGNTIGMIFRTVTPDSTKRCEIALSENVTYTEPQLDIVYNSPIPKSSGLL